MIFLTKIDIYQTLLLGMLSLMLSVAGGCLTFKPAVGVLVTAADVNGAPG